MRLTTQSSRFTLWKKTSGDVDAYGSYGVMQSFLEAIDVENSEYEAYDEEGFILQLGISEATILMANAGSDGKSVVGVGFVGTQI